MKKPYWESEQFSEGAIERFIEALPYDVKKRFSVLPLRTTKIADVTDLGQLLDIANEVDANLSGASQYGFLFEAWKTLQNHDDEYYGGS